MTRVKDASIGEFSIYYDLNSGRRKEFDRDILVPPIADTSWTGDPELVAQLEKQRDNGVFAFKFIYSGEIINQSRLLCYVILPASGIMTREGLVYTAQKKVVDTDPLEWRLLQDLLVDFKIAKIKEREGRTAEEYSYWPHLVFSTGATTEPSEVITDVSATVHVASVASNGNEVRHDYSPLSKADLNKYQNSFLMCVRPSHKAKEQLQKVLRTKEVQTAKATAVYNGSR